MKNHMAADSRQYAPEQFAWPPERVGDALEALAVKNKLGPHVRKTPNPPDEHGATSHSDWSKWLKQAANWLGFEVEPVESAYQEIDVLLKQAAPALIRIRENGKTLFLALQGYKRKKVILLRPDLSLHRVPIYHIKRMICKEVEAPHRQTIEDILLQSGVSPKKLHRAEEAFLNERLHALRISCCWLVRARPGGHFFTQLRHWGIFRKLGIVAASYTTAHLLWLLSWWLMGNSALKGRLDPGLITAWALVLLAVIPFKMLTTWYQGRVAIAFGGLLKQRLLMGALRLSPDEVTRQGSGQLLAKVMESSLLESMGLGTAFQAIFALIDLAAAFWILTQGAAPLCFWLLLLWMPVTAYMGWKIYQSRIHWTDARLQMTNHLLEHMTGYLTRLVQERRPLWHDGEDWLQEQYLEKSRHLDRANTTAYALMPNCWLVLGLLGIAPAFISGNAGLFPLAVSLAGVLLAYGALDKIRLGAHRVSMAGVAWHTVSQLFHAASRPERDTPPTIGLLPEVGEGTFGHDQVVLEAHELLFRYRPGTEPIIRHCNLEIRQGERILLEGPSGGGKSTLISLLLGMRTPESGLILLHGLDRHSLGPDCWRSRISSAPQFQENHIFTGSLAFNLLMGRRWPPQPEDLEEAETICRELGLGDLLAQMPAGLMQMVGESGWRLSHGERSRIYIARALLQGAEFIIFDESFGTLDPENMRIALDCVFKHARTLLVIAHP